MDIPPTRRVRFEPSRSLKKSVEKSMELFEEEDLAVKYGLKEK
jgi:hypothetical protein